MKSPATVLHYATRRRRSLDPRRGRWLVVTIVACCAIAGAGRLLKSARIAWADYRGRRSFERTQEPYVHYTAPVDQVVLESRVAPDGGRLPALLPTQAGLPADVAAATPGVATLFLHGRQTPKGQGTVWLGAWADLNRYDDGTHVAVSYSYDGWRYSSEGVGSLVLPRLGDHDVVLFYAGQPDPQDPTHFTVRYAINGQPGTLDGWVRVVRRRSQLTLRLRDASDPPVRFYIVPSHNGW